MGWVNNKECEAAGIDPKEVMKVIRLYEKAGKATGKLGRGVLFFAGAGASLRFNDDHPEGKGAIVIGEIEGLPCDGGDGACGPDKEDGLIRGEGDY